MLGVWGIFFHSSLLLTTIVPFSNASSTEADSGLDDYHIATENITSGSTNGSSNFRQLTETTGSPEPGLALHSSLNQINSTTGEPLYAVPIYTKILQRVLHNAEYDLPPYSATYGADQTTNHFVSNSSSWSFQVIVTKGTLRYESIIIIVNRFLKLVPDMARKPVTFTRVGVVVLNGEPVANVFFIPSEESFEHDSSNFSAAIMQDVHTGQVLVETILPTGNRTSWENFNPSQYDYNATNSPLPKRINPELEERRIAVIGTGIIITVHLYRTASGALRRATTETFAGAIYAALDRLRSAVVQQAIKEPFPSDYDTYRTSRISSGFYTLGSALSDFSAWTDATLDGVRLLDADTWTRIVKALIHDQHYGFYAGADPQATRQKLRYAIEGELLFQMPDNTEAKVGGWYLNTYPDTRDEL